jgi:CDP-paratose 2-epimerase
MKILITGICGFVGNELASAWREAEPGLEIHGIDNLMRAGSEHNRLGLRKHGVRFYHGDLRCASDFDLLPRVDWVVDAAAIPSVMAGTDGQTGSRQLIEHNLLGTVNVLEYCKRHRAGFTLLSTSRVYSIAALALLPVVRQADRFLLRDDAPLAPGVGSQGIGEAFSTSPPVSLYGSAKLASEILALEYGQSFDFPVWINRCGVLAGAGQFGRPDQGILAYWVNAYLRRRPLAYLGFSGNGCQVRDFLHPRDLIPLMRRQVASPAAGTRVINLGGGLGNAISLAELSAWCADRFGPHPVTGSGEQRRFDVPWLVMDTSTARRQWGWAPATPLAALFDEIARHAETNPGWLEISGNT